jgi:hypothetical protein
MAATKDLWESIEDFIALPSHTPPSRQFKVLLVSWLEKLAVVMENFEKME